MSGKGKWEYEIKEKVAELDHPFEEITLHRAIFRRASQELGRNL